MSAVYRPRCAAVLTVPLVGSAAERVRTDKDGSPSIDIPLRVRRASIESNDHNHADSCKLSVEWMDAGVDPRILANATVQVYMANATTAGAWAPSPEDLRFVGIMTRPQRIAREESGFVVDLEFLDYTTMFIEAKPLAEVAVPDYSQTLSDAWRRLCTAKTAEGFSAVPGVAALANSLVFKGDAKDVQIGKAVSSRFAKLSKVPVKQGSDAWSVWQQCIGMLGLISYIQFDKCIVTTATDYYTAPNPPRLVWGYNVLGLTEARNPRVSTKGVGLTSFDAVTGTTIEAAYPPIGDERTLRKRVSAKKVSDPDAVRQASEYEYFAYDGVTNPDVLQEIARRAYEERSRQELEGSAVTSEMFCETVEGQQFNLLTLAAGNVVRIEFRDDAKELLTRFPSLSDRVNYLIGRGYAQDTAQLMAATMDDFARLEPNFFVKRVMTTYETTPDGGSFQIEINFCNRISVAGDAKAS